MSICIHSCEVRTCLPVWPQLKPTVTLIILLNIYYQFCLFSFNTLNYEALWVTLYISVVPLFFKCDNFTKKQQKLLYKI